MCFYKRLSTPSKILIISCREYCLTTRTIHRVIYQKPAEIAWCPVSLIHATVSVWNCWALVLLKSQYSGINRPWLLWKTILILSVPQKWWWIMTNQDGGRTRVFLHLGIFIIIWGLVFSKLYKKIGVWNGYSSRSVTDIAILHQCILFGTACLQVL